MTGHSETDHDGATVPSAGEELGTSASVEPQSDAPNPASSPPLPEAPADGLESAIAGLTESERARILELSLANEVDEAVGRVLADRDQTFAQMLPGLSVLRSDPPLHDLDRRSRNCLLRGQAEGAITWELLSGLRPADVLSMTNAGATTLRRTIAWMYRHSRTAAADTGAVSDDPSMAAKEGPLLGPNVDVALKRLARWWQQHHDQVPSLGELLALGSDGSALPPDIEQDAQWLSGLSVAATESPPRWGSWHVEQLREVCEDEREWEIFCARTGAFGPERRTLAEIGEQFGVTRERIRQLGNRVNARITGALRDAREFEDVRWRAHRLATELGDGAPLSSPGAARALARDEPDDQLARWLAGPYVVDEGWIRRDDADPRAALEERVLSSEQFIFDEPHLMAMAQDAGIVVAAALDAIEDLECVRPVGDAWVRWVGSIPDKAEVVLSLLGEPATAEDLLSHFISTRSLTSVKNALAIDDRFIRAGKHTWALARWGVEEYSGIVEEIKERIERDGGSTPLNPLVEELVSLFDVSDASVRSYAATLEFVIEGGHVRLRDASERAVTVKQLSDTPRVYRVGSGEIVTRFEVDRDVLRGSGQSVSSGLAGQLRLAPGEVVAFAGEHQEIRVSWRLSATTGPDIGSLGPTAMALDARHNDNLVVAFDLVQETAHAWVVPQELAGLERLRALTGLGEGGDVERALAEAIGVATTELRGALRARHENDLIDLLVSESADAPSRHVSELAQFLDDL